MDLSAWLASRTVRAMAGNFAVIFGGLAGCGLLLTPKRVARAGDKPASALEAMRCDWEPKRRLEALWLAWAGVWVACFGAIIGLGMYTWFGAWHYAGVCGALAAPLLLQPLLLPGLTGEAGVPLGERHCFKANAWIFIFGFIGNWWYTHYFYTVLQASYSMPAHDVNGVPVGAKTKVDRGVGVKARARQPHRGHVKRRGSSLACSCISVEPFWMRCSKDPPPPCLTLVISGWCVLRAQLCARCLSPSQPCFWPRTSTSPSTMSSLPRHSGKRASTRRG
jgi:hypothetical protein